MTNREEQLTYHGPLPDRVKELPLSTRKKHPLAGKGPGVTSTSRQAFKKDVQLNIGAKQMEVYVAISMAKRPINSQEIAKYLGWPINSVTGRVKELREMGKVEEAFTDVYPATGRRTKYWSVTKGGE